MISIKLEKQRWVILAVYCYFQFINQQAWNNYSPIITAASQYYNRSEDDIIWFINTWYISYSTLAIFSIPVFLWRFDYAIYIGTLLNALGGWVRYAAFDNFDIAIVGNLIISIAQLFSLSAPPFIAERFFSVDERDLSNSVGYFAGLIGIAIGFQVPCFVIENDISKIEPFFLYSAILMTIPFPLSLVTMKNKPNNPANYSSITTKLPILKSLKEVFININNVIILVCFTIYQGIQWAFSSSMAYIILPQGYDIFDLGYIGIAMSITGTIAGLIASLYLQSKLKNNQIPPYDQIIRWLAIISFIPVCILAFVLYYSKNNSKILIYIMCSLMGTGFNAFIPIALQSIIETMYPVHELIITTSFNIMSNLLGFGASVVIVNPAIAEYGLLIINGIIVPILIYIFFSYKTQLNRLKQEKKNQSEQENKYVNQKSEEDQEQIEITKQQNHLNQHNYEQQQQITEGDQVYTNNNLNDKIKHNSNQNQ